SRRTAAQAAARRWPQPTVAARSSKALELAVDDEERRQIRLQRGQALVELLDRPRAAEELAALIPELEGSERLEALLWRGIAEVWSEHDQEAVAGSAGALSLRNPIATHTPQPAPPSVPTPSFP